MKQITTRQVLIVLAIIALGYGVLNHSNHLAPYSPFLFLLACLGMHFIMHNHGGHNHKDHE